MRRLSPLIPFLTASTAAVAWILFAIHGTPLHLALAGIATLAGCLIALAQADRSDVRPLDREQMESAMSREIFRARRYERPFAALIVDVGSAPAELAPEIGTAIRRLIRKTDEVGLWAEQRLVLVLSESKSSDATALGNRIRKELMPDAKFGVTAYQQDDSIQTIVQRLETSLEGYSRYFLGSETLDASTSS